MVVVTLRHYEAVASLFLRRRFSFETVPPGPLSGFWGEEE